ncbi:S-layer family protein [Leptothermofonsia sichuanensis E412]|uniref:beta strand repeat-containing protein n=1 Tax=Leptothermofonsia sichuanensis TaxID=2917832 RepID=UPI001CA66B49|nr:S-layer family protein [Leptothermofonsia sichuanensis]QZZ20504.1 S-layer family protein [Leptothermofonsia sichuanensis E412]
MNRLQPVQSIDFSRLLLSSLFAGMMVSHIAPVSAQIIPDATLPNPSSVPAGCTACTIEGGTVRGSNWFHSFSQFSIPTGGEAFFNNADPAIQNIIARVTGGSASSIDGVLRANGTANLFLLNPSGIVFGPNAQLNLGGSFIASTADRLLFADGTEFSAVNPTVSPLLTVSVPLGLQYGSDPGPIEVQGPGNNLFVATDPFEIVRAFRPPGLQVQPGQTLALVGGNLFLPGGNLTAEGGRIELGSVTGGTVSLVPTNPGWAVSYQGAAGFGEIRLTQAASADVSGDSGGTVQVQGRRVSLAEGSSLLTLTTGSGRGGQLTIRATESVEVSGFSTDPVFGPLFPSSLLAEVDLGATGQGGDVTITTGQLLLTDGAKVSVSTSGPGPGGNLQIQAETIELARSSLFFGPSQLAADAGNPDSGQGGSIKVGANQIRLGGGGWITAIAEGTGNAGTIRLSAEAIDLTGGSVDDLPALITTQVAPDSSGNGGEIWLQANRLKVSDGAQVSTSTFGAGNAGRLQIFAQDIEVIGGAVQGPSALLSTVEPGATGQGGNLEITTGRLRVADGAQVASDTLGEGKAGDLLVNARIVELAGFSLQGSSGLFAGALIGSGAGGDVRVTADRLVIRDGATISVSNFPSRDLSIPAGTGSVGNIQINSRFVQLDGESSLTAASAGGDKGNIFVNAQVIELRRGSSISTNALGTATGGNISINTDFLVAVKEENSDITANAVSNFGGRVVIEAISILGLEFRPQLTPFSDITASSDLGPLFSGVVEIRTPDSDPSRGITSLPSGLTDASDLIAATCERAPGNTFLVVGRGGLPTDASQPLRGSSVWSDLRLSAISRQSGQNTGPSKLSPTVQSSGTRKPPEPIVEAQRWVKDEKGQIFLVTQVSQTSGVGQWDTVIDCATHRSALPSSSDNNLQQRTTVGGAIRQ